VISLGSNLGDRMAHLSAGVEAFGKDVRAVSSVYRTPPWGPVPQDDYYNLVFISEDGVVDAGGWLARCRSVEEQQNRDRTVRWGPRTLDADVITVDGQISDTDPDLVLPHPRAHERAFVLVPWAEIDPTATLPGYGPIADLLDGLDRSGIHRVGHLRAGQGRSGHVRRP
jgi:2-amino-4-hydroxy-6-hydroxymethyldihydropteridine diphosphokinase